MLHILAKYNIDKIQSLVWNTFLQQILWLVRGCDTENAKLTLTERDKCFVVTGALPLPGRGEDGDSDRLY